MKQVIIFIFIFLIGITSVQTKSLLGAEKNASSTDPITENALQSGQTVSTVKRESANTVTETQKALEPVTQKKPESTAQEQENDQRAPLQTAEQTEDKAVRNDPHETEETMKDEVVLEEVVVEDRDPLRAKTLVNNMPCCKKLRLSGYFAPMIRMGEVNGSFAAFAGAKGGFMINDFVIGGAYFMYTDYMKRIINTHNHKVLTQYGGMVLEYNFFRREIVNFSVGTIIGGGTSGYYYRKDNYYYDDDDDDDEYRYKGTQFFVMEPEVMIYVNIARFFRIGVGASYRYTNGLDKYGLSDKTFDGFNGLLMFQFGWF